MKVVTPPRTTSVDIEAGTASLAELAAERAGLTLSEWLTRAARDAIMQAPLGRQATEWDQAAAVAEDFERAAEDAAIEAAEAARRRAAG